MGWREDEVSKTSFNTTRLLKSLSWSFFGQGSWSIQYVVSKQDVFFYLWDYSLKCTSSKCIILLFKMHYAVLFSSILYESYNSSFHSGHSGEGHYIIVLMKCLWCNGLSALNECNDRKTSPGLQMDVLFDFSCSFVSLKNKNVMNTLCTCPFNIQTAPTQKGRSIHS